MRLANLEPWGQLRIAISVARVLELDSRRHRAAGRRKRCARAAEFAQRALKLCAQSGHARAWASLAASRTAAHTACRPHLVAACTEHRAARVAARRTRIPCRTESDSTPWRPRCRAARRETLALALRAWRRTARRVAAPPIRSRCRSARRVATAVAIAARGRAASLEPTSVAARTAAEPAAGPTTSAEATATFASPLAAKSAASTAVAARTAAEPAGPAASAEAATAPASAARASARTTTIATARAGRAAEATAATGLPRSSITIAIECHRAMVGCA
jgi:hypothetical protein